VNIDTPYLHENFPFLNEKIMREYDMVIFTMESMSVIVVVAASDE